MGRFANRSEHETAGYLGAATIGLPWNGESGYEAMGHAVPMFRRAEGERHLKDMGFTDAERRFSIVNGMALCIERDNTHEAMEAAFEKGLDVTGVYRLLAVLLCAEKPAEA
jgi:hypothetical protein